MNLPEAQPSVTTAATAGHDDLRRRVAELAEAVAARDAFIAVAAHELRNPMTPILGQVDLMLAVVKAGGYSPEQLEQRLGRIQHSIHRYLKRAEVLFGVSRLNRGRFRPDLEAFDLAVLLREAAGEFALAARHAGVPVTLAVPETLPVHLDRLATEQIVDNLVSNALKYGGRTPVEIAAEVIGNRVRIAVRDHGAGMPQGDRMRLFESFERVAGESEQRSGFGIGLWLVGRFVAAMAGTVTVDDAPGGGALLTVTLPLHIEEERT